MASSLLHLARMYFLAHHMRSQLLSYDLIRHSEPQFSRFGDQLRSHSAYPLAIPHIHVEAPNIDPFGSGCLSLQTSREFLDLNARYAYPLENSRESQPYEARSDAAFAAQPSPAIPQSPTFSFMGGDLSLPMTPSLVPSLSSSLSSPPDPSCLFDHCWPASYASDRRETEPHAIAALPENIAVEPAQRASSLTLDTQWSAASQFLDPLSGSVSEPDPYASGPSPRSRSPSSARTSPVSCLESPSPAIYYPCTQVPGPTGSANFTLPQGSLSLNSQYAASHPETTASGYSHSHSHSSANNLRVPDYDLASEKPFIRQSRESGPNQAAPTTISPRGSVRRHESRVMKRSNSSRGVRWRSSSEDERSLAPASAERGRRKGSLPTDTRLKANERRFNKDTCVNCKVSKTKVSLSYRRRSNYSRDLNKRVNQIVRLCGRR